MFPWIVGIAYLDGMDSPDSSSSEEGECIPNTPLHVRGSNSSHQSVIEVNETPEHLWTTLEYEKHKKCRAQRQWFPISSSLV